jgi:hypothetical protein
LQRESICLWVIFDNKGDLINFPLQSVPQRSFLLGRNAAWRVLLYLAIELHAKSQGFSLKVGGAFVRGRSLLVEASELRLSRMFHSGFERARDVFTDELGDYARGDQESSQQLCKVYPT